MWELIGKVLAAAISSLGGILSSYLLYQMRFKNDEEKNKGEGDDEIGEHIEYAQRIDRELRSILETVEADRVWIAQFHNGKEYYPPSSSNNSMKKISVTNEVTSPGISKERSTFSNMLVSFFSDMILDVSEENHVRYASHESDKSPDEVDVLFRQRGCKSMDLFSMKNLDEKLVGILGVDHMHNASDFSDKKINYLNKKANLLGGLLYYGNIEQVDEPE